MSRERLLLIMEWFIGLDQRGHSNASERKELGIIMGLKHLKAICRQFYTNFKTLFIDIKLFVVHILFITQNISIT